MASGAPAARTWPRCSATSKAVPALCGCSVAPGSAWWPQPLAKAMPRAWHGHARTPSGAVPRHAKHSPGCTWHCRTAPSHARPHRAMPSRSEPNPAAPGRLCQAARCRRRARGTCPLLPAEGRRGRRAPGAGAHPHAGRSLRLGARQLGLPRQAAGNGPGATGCGAAPAAAEQARPAGQAAAAPETGSRAVPTARDAGATEILCPPPLLPVPTLRCPPLRTLRCSPGPR